MKRKKRANGDGPVTLLVGTQKGAWVLESDRDREGWKMGGPHFLGNIIQHFVADPRDPEVWLIAARTGHLGPTVFRSRDRGKSWTEAETPPAFPKAAEGEEGESVSRVFWLTPGHESEPGVWYAGTTPFGLFRSEDGGATWEGVRGFNEDPIRKKCVEFGGTPDGPITHSILVDPRDARHLYLGLSTGGVFESEDRGESWRTLNKGCEADFLPDPNADWGHDPHCVQLHPLRPDRLYQQNHCGIYRMERGDGEWIRIGRNMPKKVGDIGFPVTLHPRDPDTAWVFPMDGTEVWPRTSPDGRPAVYVTKDAGESWKRLDGGLPDRQAWWTVFRQAMAADRHDPVGLYFGTTSGEIWTSANEGKDWTFLAAHLPRVLSVEVAG
ncbi:MAG: glycosyl hydrolase [Candidatus Eisenbacteria bacterium]|nr:glycosyl hydrolase [Candidatus Latescibacterota bacterium]MBD3301098.1 glycosyl hydrolase [Candidatus Eisenbacteria bacterium]